MYEDLISKIEQKVDVLAKKSGLEQVPKIKVIKGTTGVNANTNILSLQENMLSQWHKGEISETDVNGILAHEFGHLIENLESKWGRKSDRQLTGFIMILVVASILYYILQVPLPFIGYPVISLVWVAFIPYVLRRIYVPGELAADRNAIAFSLITDEEMANCIVRRVTGKLPKMRLGPLDMLRLIENRMSHPFLAEHLANIGFEIVGPINVKKLSDN